MTVPSSSSPVADPLRPPAYILCGGRSSRFGSDKARAVIDGVPLLLHLGDALKRTGHCVHYVADSIDRYRDLGITCLVDARANCGPLAGLCRALEHHASLRASLADRLPRSDWLLLVNCDQARWDPQWSSALDDAARTAGSALAAAFFDTAWQPLPALLHVDLLAEVPERLNYGRLSLKHLLADLESRGRSAKVSTRRPPSSWSFNTPDELAKIPKP